MFGSRWRVLRLLVLGVQLASAPGGSADAKIMAPFAKSPTIGARRMALGDWRLRIERSRFSKEVRCILADRRHHIVYASGALGFRFRHRVNTLGAWIAVDGEPATRWQDELPELTRLGVPIDGASLDDPTDSTVWIPARRLEDATRVTIQPRADMNWRTYRLKGFYGLREIARSMGCTPETRFAP